MVLPGGWTRVIKCLEPNDEWCIKISFIIWLNRYSATPWTRDYGGPQVSKSKKYYKRWVIYQSFITKIYFGTLQDPLWLRVYLGTAALYLISLCPDLSLNSLEQRHPYNQVNVKQGTPSSRTLLTVVILTTFWGPHGIYAYYSPTNRGENGSIPEGKSHGRPSFSKSRCACTNTNDQKRL